MTRYRIERLNLLELAGFVMLLGAGAAVLLGLVLLIVKGWILP